MKYLNTAIVLLFGCSLILMSNSEPNPEKISEYSVIRQCGLKGHERIEDEVNQKIKDGWQPLGGITFADACFTQAMGR